MILVTEPSLPIGCPPTRRVSFCTVHRFIQKVILNLVFSGSDGG
jgi:hypothetical protein